MNKISNIYNYIIFSGIKNLPFSYFLLFQCHQSRKGYIYLESVSLHLCFTWFTSFFFWKPLAFYTLFRCLSCTNLTKMSKPFQLLLPCALLTTSYFGPITSGDTIYVYQKCYFHRLQFAVQTLCWIQLSLPFVIIRKCRFTPKALYITSFEFLDKLSP